MANEKVNFIPNETDNLTPSQEAINTIREELSISLGEDTYQLTTQDLKSLLSYCIQYKEELNHVSSILHSIDDHIDALRQRYIEDNIGFQRNGEPPSINYVIYSEIRNELPTITETLKQGYRIISLIRQMFTNEKIVYEVGIESNKNKKKDVRNFEITEEQLLESAKLSYSPQAKKIEDLLKLNVGAYGQISSQEAQAKSDIEKQLYGKQTIFGKVSSVLTNGKYLEQLNIKKANRGYIYEAYKYILSQRQYSNKNSKGITPKEIVSAYRTVTKNNLIFYSGGDFLNKQYKLLSSKPQIVSFKTLCIFFQEFINAMNDFLATNNKQEFIDFLNNKFTQDTQGRAIVDKIAKQAEEEARNNIRVIIEEIV